MWSQASSPTLKPFRSLHEQNTSEPLTRNQHFPTTWSNLLMSVTCIKIDMASGKVCLSLHPSKYERKMVYWYSSLSTVKIYKLFQLSLCSSVQFNGAELSALPAVHRHCLPHRNLCIYVRLYVSDRRVCVICLLLSLCIALCLCSACQYLTVNNASLL